MNEPGRSRVVSALGRPSNARAPKRELDGRDETREIVDAMGETSLLRFESALAIGT